MQEGEIIEVPFLFAAGASVSSIKMLDRAGIIRLHTDANWPGGNIGFKVGVASGSLLPLTKDGTEYTEAVSAGAQAAICSPSDLAGFTFVQLTFGAPSVASSVGGTPTTVTAITRRI
jgi:hypothetical protein